MIFKQFSQLLKKRDIKYFDPKTESIETEKIYGQFFLQLLYHKSWGKSLSKILPQHLLSHWYGEFQNTSFSAQKIKKFINQYNISMDDFLPEENHSIDKPYSSFNSFFIRRLRPQCRNFPTKPNEMGAFAEGRYSVYQAQSQQDQFPIKNQNFTLKSLFQNSKWENTFLGGTLFIARLCPVDYHRYHYPDNGKVLESYKVGGHLESVNPVALDVDPEILCTNERHISILETENFGLLAYIEVGAFMVGKIVQRLNQGDTFKRGEEKGHFLFGGSTVLLIAQKDFLEPCGGTLKRTAENNMETLFQLGNVIATKKTSHPK
jgi:phosphatidylserine decarboxylase